MGWGILHLEVAMSSSDPFDLTDFPWPCNDDDLFDTSGPWTGHAVLDWQRNAVSGRMDGYRRAAEVLVEHVLKHRGDLDYLIFPIANCWRHHVELQLKSLLTALRQFHDEPDGIVRGHDVLKLWREVQPRLASAFPDEPPSDAVNVGRVIQQLHSADPDGQNFRYHRRTDGSLALTGIDRVDVRAWHDALGGVSNFLSGAGGILSEYQEIKDDLERDMRDDYGP
jgi:hypothetical protein